MQRKLTATAKSLRRRMTDAEIKLWKHLNRKQLAVKFRRQCPIGSYIVDFVSFDGRVIVEVDGGKHVESKTDESRDKWLVSQGFKVLRFWNNEVLTNLKGVLEAIRKEISSPPP